MDVWVISLWLLLTGLARAVDLRLPLGWARNGKADDEISMQSIGVPVEPSSRRAFPTLDPLRPVISSVLRLGRETFISLRLKASVRSDVELIASPVPI